jgi:hypothetical protein
MSHDHDVLHFEHIDRKLEDGQIIGILWRGEVRDIPVDEKLSWVETNDCVGGHATIGTTDPQVFRRLLAFESQEEIRVFGDHPRRPGAVVFL